MPRPLVSKASTVWNGELITGSGTTTLDSSGQGTFGVAWKARAENHEGATNPEELLAAAHATCFSMALAHALAGNETPATQLETSAEVTFVAGTGITGIALSVTGQVPGLDADQFQTFATGAKENCPVSQALKGTEITLDATLA